jgi:DNA mismatch endonuclease, patch repair protein
MTDIFSIQKRSEIMRSIKGKDTTIEKKIRSALHKSGYRYRLHDSQLPGTPDIVLKKFQSIIQIRGCFWHNHSCPNGHLPKSNTAFWSKKLIGNQERDRRTDNLLRKAGWKVIVVWECSCKTKHAFQKELKRIVRLVEKKPTPASSWTKQGLINY